MSGEGARLHFPMGLAAIYVLYVTFKWLYIKCPPRIGLICTNHMLCVMCVWRVCDCGMAMSMLACLLLWPCAPLQCNPSGHGQQEMQLSRVTAPDLRHACEEAVGDTLLVLFLLLLRCILNSVTMKWKVLWEYLYSGWYLWDGLITLKRTGVPSSLLDNRITCYNVRSTFLLLLLLVQNFKYSTIIKSEPCHYGGLLEADFVLANALCRINYSFYSSHT